MRTRKTIGTALLATGAALVVATCGGDGGGSSDDGGGGGNPTANITGQVTSVELATSATSSWSSRLAKMLAFVTEAYAQATEGSVSGVVVTASSSNGTQTATTDDLGAFSFPSAPSGDVTLAFAVGSDCSRSFLLADVVDDSTLSVGDITVDCALDRTFATNIREVFRGVVHSIVEPGGFQTDVVMCAASGGQNVERLLRNVNMGDPDIGVLAVGDLIEVDGSRDFADIPAIDFRTDSATVIAHDQSDPCAA